MQNCTHSCLLNVTPYVENPTDFPPHNGKLLFASYPEGINGIILSLKVFVQGWALTALITLYYDRST